MNLFGKFQNVQHGDTSDLKALLPISDMVVHHVVNMPCRAL